MYVFSKKSTVSATCTCITYQSMYIYNARVVFYETNSKGGGGERASVWTEGQWARQSQYFNSF